MHQVQQIHRFVFRSAGWTPFVKQFGESVKQITGSDLSARTGDGRIEDEVEMLRDKVGELEREVRTSCRAFVFPV